MKNFTQLESNLSGMAWFLHVIERRFSSTDRLSGSRAESSLTSEKASIQHPLSIHSASIGHPLEVGGNQVATMLRYVATVAMLICLGVGEVWAVDPPTATFTVTPTLSSGTTYEITELDIKGSANCTWVEVPSASCYGYITFGYTSGNSRNYYIYGTNGTAKDASRYVVQYNGYYSPAVLFTPSDILTSGGKYYLVFKADTGIDFKASKVTFTTFSLTDLSSSNFYQTYANSNKTATQLITAASFPTYISTTIAAVSNASGTSSSVSTPHDFSSLASGTTYYRLKTANTNTIKLTALSNVKSIRVYGNGNGAATTISTTVTKVSGSGSTFSVSDMSTTNAKASIFEKTTGDLTAKSGYDANTYYTYTLSFNGGADIWGIYVEAGAASGCPSYSFHYGIKDASGWEQECFTYSGSDDVYYLNDFTIPASGVATHYYVGKFGSFYNSGLGNNNAKSYTDLWSSMPFTTSQGNGSGTRPKVGQATGAVGRIRIADNSTWDNLFVSFEPEGYKLKFGSSTYGDFEADGSTANLYWSPLVTYSSTNARDEVSVGVIDGSGNYVSTNNTEGMQHIFLNTGGTTYWSKDNVTNFGLYDDTNHALTCIMTKVPGEDYLYEGWVPSNCTHVIFYRLKSSTPSTDGSNVHNQTGNWAIPANTNTFTISSWSSGSWSAYSRTGKFCMNADYTDKNWYVRFCPHNVLTYDGNGGTGSVASQSVAVNAASKTVTVAANGFTREGWTFTGWNTSPYGDETAYAAGASLNLTSDVTLYAQWSKTVYVKSSQSAWYKDGDDDAWFAIYYWHDTHNGWVAMTRAEECSYPAVYKATLPGNGFDNLIFVAKNADNATLAMWENKVNQTVDITYASMGSNNQYSITTSSDGKYSGSWGTYSAPTYTISFAGGTGSSGSMDAISSIACDADQALTANSFEKTGYNFSCWHADVDVKVGGATVTEGSAIANSATIQNVSNDIALTAQWTAKTYDVTHSFTDVTRKSGGSGGTNAATYGTNYTVVVDADEGYTLPDAITVTINDVEVTEDTEYTWDQETGTVTIDGDYILGDIEITIAGEEESGDCTIFSLEDEIGSAVITNNKNGKTTITTGTSFFFESGEDRIKLTPKSGSKFKNGDAISIKGKVNKAEKNFGLKVFAENGSTSAGDFYTTGSTSSKGASCSGTLTLASDASYIFIARYASTGTTIEELEITSECASCSTPDAPTAFAKTSVTSTTATLSITDAGDAASYDLYYASGSPSTPTAETEATTNVTTKTPTITSLTANTTYKAWVRAVCDESNKSSWVALTGTTFTTLNTYTVTYNDNGSTGGTAPTDGSSPYDAGSNVTVLGNTGSLAKTNYTFDGWNTANDGSGTSYAADATISSIAANVTLYAKWKQTVTLKTGTQGSGADKTPTVVWQGTALNGFSSAHTADGYTLQGYYTAGSGGVKVLNADGTFAAANVTDYITSSKWSRTGAAPTLYAQWVASEDCSTSDFVIKKGSDTQYQGCMESSSYDGTATSFTAGSATTVGNAKMTISSYSKGAITRPGSGNTFSIVIEPVSGYYLKSICWAGKVEDDETVSYYWDDNSGSAITISPTTTSGTGVTYNAPNTTTTKFTASYVDDGDKSGGIWWRNVQVEVCAAGGTTYKVTYDGNDKTSGSAPTDATNYSYGGTVTVKGNTGSLEKTNYTFAGWTTNNDGTGSSYVEDNTFSITANTTLYAKWTQSVTLDKNGGSTDGSATAVWNATGLTGITHAKPAAGYKLLGYYSASSDGTKVLNSDGSFAATNVTGYITSGKWSRTSATTLYAEYESAGALIWNLSVNTEATSLTTSSKTSAFTEISTSNMSNATVNGVNYEKSKKSSLTGKISTPSSYNADDYVYVTFQVASGYKFTPSSVKVIAQPITTAKSVKLVLEDKNDHSINFTTASTINGGTTQTVEMTNGSSVYFVGTVTLKIYCYGAEDKYRLGTPIIIEGEVEEACATIPSFTRLSFGETSYKVGDTPDNLEVVGGTNITTYAWKQNTTNDRSGGGDAEGDHDGSSYTPSTSSAGTMYYWCEMTNSTCGITIKTSAVGITVNEVKTNPTVTWDTKAKYNNTDTTAYYGGKNYTLKATLNSGWDGTLTSEMFTAPTGIRLHDFTIDNSSNPKTITATFDVLTTFDVDENDSIEFTLSLPATATYNALSSEKKVAYNECSGGGEGSSYNIRMRKTVTKDGNYYHCANTDGWVSPNISSSYSTGKAGTTMATYFDTVASSNTQYVWVRTYHANINKVRIYADFRANNMTVSNVYKHTAYFSADSKYAVDYTAVYNGDEENSNLGDAAQGYVDITLDEVMAANDILLVSFNTNRVRPLGTVITESSAGSLTTSLAWSNSLADEATVNKTQSSANFTYTASTTGTNSNTLGAVTYSSSNTSCATVNATTGEVAITASGASDLTTTITATLAASGCFQSKTITYTISVLGVSCSVTTGTLTSDVTSKCSTEDATLTLTGFESGASVQWYKGESTISDDATYDITTDGTTSTMVTKEAGTYSVMVTNAANTCSDRSNSITISNISATASVTKIVDEWYVKNGRLTPDIALWTMSEGATLKSVAWSPTNATGLDCELRDGIIYLEGKEPNTNSSSDVEYTLTATITDECGGDHVESTKTIKITHQKNTDKHVLAFVVNGTDKGGFTEGITAAQTTDVPLYKTIAANFDVQATNCYASDDEKKVKQYYSQFDVLCITDYPNSNKTGANKKKYVDVLGTLIDIRPILTMEAFVSDKANWKAKGISGNPKDPTTRQYTMDLQCKDHEIFAGTDLVKIGEGDETMYRVTMVEKDSDQYKTLDATYGAGAHGKDDGYAYHKYPALQGFTFSSEMLSDGLLPLGLIDDGSGNELQVGVERQAEMSARLMVLGVNSYAMERLTPDGQKVIINALNYLMKKREEEIADCSIAFIGGDETNPNDWETASNWKGGVKPDKTTREIRILAEVVIKNGDSIHAMAPIKIASGGTYNEGADNAKGKITIDAGGALIVDGRIQAVTAPNYSKARGTSVEDIVLNTSSSAQAALIFNNDAGDTKATVNFYSLGRKDGNFQYQYIASPMEVVPVSESYAGTGVYTYVYTEAAGWERRGYYTDLYAFEGVAITTRSTSATEYTVQGTLANTKEREISITKDHGGDNMIGNSWVAPIQISELEKAPNTATLASKTVYVYCSGRDAVVGTGASGTTETAGQWLAIPFNAASFAGWSGLKVVPAMNAFEFMATAAGTLTLNYDTLVRGNHQNLTAKARAPKRKTEHEGIDLVRIRVADTKTHIDIHLFEGDVFSEAFDDGWEAKYIDGEGVSAQLYAMNGEDKMAVLATSTLEGTVLGFVPGREREYTFSFHGADNGYYLNDLKLKTSTPISETEHYTFTYEEGDTHRFYISKTRIDAPQTPTDVTNPEVETPKAQKFIYKDKMYIMINGRVYSAEGALVK